MCKSDVDIGAKIGLKVIFETDYVTPEADKVELCRICAGNFSKFESGFWREIDSERFGCGLCENFDRIRICKRWIFPPVL